MDGKGVRTSNKRCKEKERKKETEGENEMNNTMNLRGKKEIKRREGKVKWRNIFNVFVVLMYCKRMRKKIYVQIRREIHRDKEE